jgi:multidrug resistance efflux pump
MVHEDDRLALDTQRLDVYLTGLQAEVEAKVRRVHRFREQMQQLDSGSSGKSNVAQRERAARALLTQVDQMLETNLLVREMLEDLRSAADAVLADLLDR